MTNHDCSFTARRFGYDRKHNQRFQCHICGKTWIDAQVRMLGTMRIDEAKALMALNMLVEGCSIRTIERLTSIGKTAILNLLVLAGERCEKLMRERIKSIPLELVEADEIWGYVQMKEARKESRGLADDNTVGDAYCFVGIEAKTKLIACYELGRRDIPTATRFIEKLQRASDGRFQLTTDGLRAYVGAVEDVFGADIDYGMLIKSYVSDTTGKGERRYSPGDFIAATKLTVTGNPDHSKLSTSYVERQNLTIRMMMRRLTRLTNAFSKKWENLNKAYALHFAYYNFCRVHSSLRVTPAMEATITDHVWSIAEMLTA
jgi:IS1 family transposase/transposase-like protein